MKKFVVATLNGEIIRSGYCSPGMMMVQAQLGEVVLEGSGDSQTHYVVNGEIVPRPVMPVTVSGTVETGEDWTITDIPVGTRVFYPGGMETVNDGFISWASAVPGEFEFRLLCFPYLDFVTHAHVSNP